MIIIIFFFFRLKIFSRGQVHEALLHFIVLLGLLKKIEAKNFSILEECYILSLHVIKYNTSYNERSQKT